MTTEKEITEVAKTLTDYPLGTWLWVVGLSIWGGVVSWVQKVRKGDARWFNLVEFVGELAVCSFTGVVTFLLCAQAGFDDLLTAALVAISSHMGTRGLYTLEQFVSKKFGLEPAPPG